MKTVDFLDAAKEKCGIQSDYALAKMLECKPSAISNYRNGRSRLDDDTAMKVADLLDLDPAYVVACIHAERAKHDAERKLWERIAERMAVAASAACLVALPALQIGQGVVCILC